MKSRSKKEVAIIYGTVCATIVLVALSCYFIGLSRAVAGAPVYADENVILFKSTGGDGTLLVTGASLAVHGTVHDQGVQIAWTQNGQQQSVVIERDKIEFQGNAYKSGHVWIEGPPAKVKITAEGDGMSVYGEGNGGWTS